MRRAAVELLAPAKVNLALHVVGRRADGYHLLDSLVVFADAGDRVGLTRAEHSSIAVKGPFAASVPTDGANLALRAARFAGAEVAITLDKALPVGAGIGGGSSDAAAVLRGISALADTSVPDPLRLGADVPVCLAARPARMRGVGEILDPLPPLPELPMVLVHPRVEVSTAAVFGALGAPDRDPMPETIPAWATAGEAAEWLTRQRNDLEPAAMHHAPAIAEAKAALAAEPACLLARMSGSGSTVFGLFATADHARRAAAELADAHPGWWVRSVRALSEQPAIQESRVTT